MINNHSYSEILNMLQAGVPIDEIARDFTETLNAAEADFRKSNAEAELNEQIQDLTHSMNTILENWRKLYGNEKSSCETFTVADMIGILNAKIQGKNLKQEEKPCRVQEPKKKQTLQEFVNDMTPDELAAAWEDALDTLLNCFSHEN